MLKQEDSLYFLTYTSIAKRPFLEAEIKDVLEYARKRNEACGLTGLLMCRSEVFFQLLEGRKEDVLATFQRIAKDPRHTKLKVLLEVEIEGADRIFPNWRMGLISQSLAGLDQEHLLDSLLSISQTNNPSKTTFLNLMREFSASLPNSAKKIIGQSTAFGKVRRSAS